MHYSLIIKSVFLKSSVHIVSLLFFCGIALGQTQSKDSVHKKVVDSLIQMSAAVREFDLDSSMVISKKALNYASEHSYLMGIAQSYSSLGTGYSYLGDEGMALFYMKKSLSALEQIGDEKLINKTIFNITATLISLEAYEEAKVMLARCHQYYLNQKDTLSLSSTFYLKGILKEEMNQPLEDIIYNYTKTINLAESIKDTISLNQGLNALGRIAIEKEKNFNKGLPILKRSENVILKHNPNDLFTIGFTYLELSRAYLLNNQLNEALAYIEKALKAHLSLDFTYGLSEIYKTRKVILQRMGNYKDALKAATLMDIQKDALQKEDINMKASMMRVEYEVERINMEKETAEAKTQLAEERNLKNKYYLVGTIIIALLLVASSYLYITRLRINKTAQLMELKLEAEQKGHAAKMSELKALRSQMNPHFIFNAMNSVQSLIIKDKKDEAYNYLTKLSQLIRKTLTSSDKSMVYLDDELDQLVNYLELEKLRFKQDFVYHVIIDENIDQVKIPSMIIQPFVENAVKHGLLHKEGMKRLSIDFNLKANLLQCVVEDNGVGRKASQEINNLKPDYQTSFSTNAIQKRFELYQQYSDKPIGFEYEDLYNNEEPSGTRVTISIPFTTDDN